MKQLNVVWGKFLKWSINIFSSRSFFWFTVIFFFLQASWVASSFLFPMVLDERYHLGVINFFASHPSPFVTSQSLSNDQLGNLAYGNASLYHYLMSFPYRVITSLTHHIYIQIVSMRILNIVFVCVGLYIFEKLFTENGIKRVYANLTIFFYSLIPLVSMLAATISYDNMLFPLAAAVLLLGCRIIKSNRLMLLLCLQFISLGLLGCLVKFTFLPIFTAAVIYIIYEKRKTISFKNIRYKLKFQSVQKSKQVYYPWIILLILCSTLFFSRYVVSFVKYGSPIPDCKQVLTYERCLSSPVYKSIQDQVATKHKRLPLTIPDYALQWTQTVTSQFEANGSFTTNNTIESGKRLPIEAFLQMLSIFAGTTVLIYMWRTMKKPKTWSFLIIISITLVLTTFVFNLSSYYLANTDLNTQGRYLLSIIPIVMGMALVSISRLLKNHQSAKVVLVYAVIIMSSQGGGIIKHIVTSNSTWFWQYPVIVNTNEKARDFLRPIVNQSSRI